MLSLQIKQQIGNLTFGRVAVTNLLFLCTQFVFWNKKSYSAASDPVVREWIIRQFESPFSGRFSQIVSEHENISFQSPFLTS